MARTTILDACVKVLSGSEEPLSPGEIYRQIVDNKLFEFQAKAPCSILRSSIRKRLRKEGGQRIRDVGNGQYSATT